MFEEYYTEFRGTNDVPTSSDPEWTIAVRLANGVLRRFVNVEGEMWDFLWTTASQEGYKFTYNNTNVNPTITTFTCPANMKMPGGWLRFTDPVSGSYFRVDVIPVYLVQTRDSNVPFAYFTGDENNGFTLNLSMGGNMNIGWTIDFPYYKQPTYFDASRNATGGVNETGNTITECPNANFIISGMLAKRFKSTRNYPSYQIASKDSETALQDMQIKNRIGVDGHPWNSLDTSSGAFGSVPSGFGI